MTRQNSKIFTKRKMYQIRRMLTMKAWKSMKISSLLGLWRLSSRRRTWSEVFRNTIWTEANSSVMQNRKLEQNCVSTFWLHSVEPTLNLEKRLFKTLKQVKILTMTLEEKQKQQNFSGLCEKLLKFHVGKSIYCVQRDTITSWKAQTREQVTRFVKLDVSKSRRFFAQKFSKSSSSW